MPYPYVSIDQVKRRIGLDECDRLFDDNGDGVADVSIFDELRMDASAKVKAHLLGKYNLESVAENTPREVVRLTLDACKVYAAQRHPEVVRYEWKPLWDALNSDLEKISSGSIRIEAEGLPEQPTNNAATVVMSVY